MERNFMELLKKRWEQGCFVCVGLDSDLAEIPQDVRNTVAIEGGEMNYGTMYLFNRLIIDATKEFVCAYKPNVAFYEEQGNEGVNALRDTISYILGLPEQIPVILDAKRADIGNTNKGYAKSAFNIYRADAITVNPYFGEEALGPFLECKNKGIIVLCRTSNPGAKELQDLTVKLELGEAPLYQVVANNVNANWNKNGNCCLVVGATYPEELAIVRKIAPKMPILIPGIGKQGGDIKKTVKAGLDEDGQGIIVNSSRGIIFASKEKDFTEAAKREAYKLNFLIDYYRTKELIVKKIFRDTKAIITDSHIVYTSWKHGSAYVNKDAIYPHTESISYLCRLFADYFRFNDIDAVVAPAKGGIVLSQWVAYHLSKMKGTEVLALYAEKITDDEEKQKFVIKRGYDKDIIGKNIIVLEDVVTTGGSVKETIDVAKKLGGNVIGVGLLANRNPVQVTAKSLGVPDLFALREIPLDAFESDECPLCKANVPINTNVGKGEEYLAKKRIKENNGAGDGGGAGGR